jgi:hypothetical protein
MTTTNLAQRVMKFKKKILKETSKEIAKQGGQDKNNLKVEAEK